MRVVDRLRFIVCAVLTTGCITASSSSFLPTKKVEESSEYNTPVIGILTQPRYKHSKSESPAPGGHHHTKENVDYYYVAASYVKWLESGGARSIAIPYDANDDLVDEIFAQVNGILFPGGGSPLPPAARRVWDLVNKANDEGDYFPLWGTCQGFEYLNMLAADAGTHILQSGFDAENISLPLIFVDEEQNYDSMLPTAITKKLPFSLRRKFPNPPLSSDSSTSLSSLLYSNDHLRSIVSKENITMNNHRMGIEPTHFHNDAGLSSIFRISTTSMDRSGRSFVSTIEPNDPQTHPFYGVQFHPEKNAFEYGTYPGTDVPYEAINHSPDGVELSFDMARFFVSMVQTNLEQNTNGGNVFGRRHEYTNPLRHPYVQTYEMDLGLGFEELYVVPSAEEWGQATTVAEW